MKTQSLTVANTTLSKIRTGSNVYFFKYFIDQMFSKNNLFRLIAAIKYIFSHQKNHGAMAMTCVKSRFFSTSNSVNIDQLLS